jgi:hypothetical protein
VFYTGFGGYLTHIDSIISQLEHQKDAISSAIAALRAVGTLATVNLNRPAGRKPSTEANHVNGQSEGRQRQIVAMRLYWAGKKAAQKKAAHGRASAAVKKSAVQRGITPAGRKRLSEMMKKRWAKKRIVEKI